jgi:hypothetical protein
MALPYNGLVNSPLISRPKIQTQKSSHSIHSRFISSSPASGSIGARPSCAFTFGSFPERKSRLA